MTLEAVLLPQDYQRVTSPSYAAAERTHASAKLKQTRKLSKLTNSKKRPELHPQGLDRWVVNLTGHPLTAPQRNVLSKGLNFAPAPTRVPVVDTIAAVEAGAKQLKEEDAEDLHGWVCGILRYAKLPKDNLTKEQRKALKELKDLENEVILAVDKCNATVVMRREDYSTKMKGMLEISTYRQLEKDPTATQESRLSRKLRELEKSGEITGICTINSGQQVASHPGVNLSKAMVIHTLLTCTSLIACSLTRIIHIDYIHTCICRLYP